MLSLFVSFAFANPYAELLGTKATSAADEYALGRELVDSQLWLMGPWKDDTQQLRVETIARRIVGASDRPDLVFNVTLLASDDVNACALPGGFLFVNKGLLTRMNDDQLAFVLGHELSHVILRHAASTMNVQTATLTMTSLAGARAADDRTTAKAKETELYLMMAGHSRQLELEADLYGMLYAVRAGYPASSAPAALRAIQATVGGDISAAELPWASHPAFVERIEQLDKGNAGIRATVAEFDAGVAWLKAGRAPAAVTSFQKFLTLFPQSEAGWADLGAAWLTEAAAGRSDPWVDVLPLHTSSGVTLRDASAVARDRARDALIHAIKLDATDPVALGLLGVLARSEGDLPSARLFFERALVVDPDSAPLHIDLGNVAAQEGKLDEALKHWAKAHELAPLLPEPTVNSARVYEQQKKKKKAIEAWTLLLDHHRWGAEASARLLELGTKASAKKAAKSGPEKFVFTKGTFGISDDEAALVTAMGAPDFSLDTTAADQPVTKYLVWDTVGLEVLTTNGRLSSLSVYDPSTAHTLNGAHIGTTEAEMVGVYGAADDDLELGAVRSVEWAPRGIGAGMQDGIVTELDLFPIP